MALRLKIVSKNAGSAGDHPRWTFGVNGGRIGRHTSNDWVLRDVQERALGVPVDAKDLRRGDLIFWQGHVAIARGGGSLLHASAFHMQVAIEPAAEALDRTRETGSEVTSVRRLATTG